MIIGLDETPYSYQQSVRFLHLLISLLQPNEYYSPDPLFHPLRGLIWRWRESARLVCSSFSLSISYWIGYRRRIVRCLAAGINPPDIAQPGRVRRCRRVHRRVENRTPKSLVHIRNRFPNRPRFCHQRFCSDDCRSCNGRKPPSSSVENMPGFGRDPTVEPVISSVRSSRTPRCMCSPS